jgi:hypothetical protein
MAEKFKGYQTPNYTQIPNVFFDHQLACLTNNEVRVLLYVYRRTFGFHKTRDAISYSQFISGITTSDGRVLDEGCGIKNRTRLSEAIQSLIEKGMLVAYKSKTGQGDAEVTAYELRFEEGVVPNRYHGSTNEVLGGGTNLVPTIDSNTKESEQTSNISKVSHISSSLNRRRMPQLPPDQLAAVTRLMEDFSREFGDMTHLRSNITQAGNVMTQYQLGVDEFFRLAYEARSNVKQAGAVKKKMPYFFRTLRDLCGDEKH